MFKLFGFLSVLLGIFFVLVVYIPDEWVFLIGFFWIIIGFASIVIAYTPKTAPRVRGK
tara:strand:+ start:539 stop:712 length:174 start_codon:yes stop_codon:yes gene_type:complete